MTATTTTVAVRVPRILVADDQPDILEALQLLFKAEGYEVETALSPAGVLLAVQRRRFRRRADRSQLRARHDIGRRRTRPARTDPDRRSDAARFRHDRMGQRRWRGRSDAARRLRLCREALGQRSPGPGRFVARSRWAAPCAPAASCRPNGYAPIDARSPPPHRGIAAHASGARPHGAHRTVGCERPHFRRARYGQRARGPVAARRVRPRDATLHRR